LQDTWALGINDAGDIAGWFDDVYDGAFYAFTRLHSGGVTTITFPGEDGSEAGDINNDGTVVGAAGGEGFRWTAGVFAGLPNGCPVSYQPRINNVGRILVGNGTCTEDGFVPFKVPVPSPYWDSTPSWHRSSRWHSNLR